MNRYHFHYKKYMNGSYFSFMPQSHCADLASRLAPTLKSALVGVQSAYVGESSGYVGVSRAGRDRSGSHPDRLLRVILYRGSAPTFLIGAKSGLSQGKSVLSRGLVWVTRG